MGRQQHNQPYMDCTPSSPSCWNSYTVGVACVSSATGFFSPNQDGGRPAIHGRVGEKPGQGIDQFCFVVSLSCFAQPAESNEWPLSDEILGFLKQFGKVLLVRSMPSGRS